MVSGETKVFTATSESLDTMATLPISVSRHHQQQHQLEKTGVTVKEKEQEAKTLQPHFVYHQIKRTSMFVVLSLLYGKLVIVACIAFVVSHEITRSFPAKYYEGFFTFLFGVSIVFLVYSFCFLLQDSSCCRGNRNKGKNPREKAAKRGEAKTKDKNKKESANGENGSQSQTAQNRLNTLQSIGTGKKITNPSEGKLTEPSIDSIDIEASSPECEFKKRKTSPNLHYYGSFFLRVGAIGFGLATMLYIGLQFGQIFEIPFTSSCYELLRAVNPILQMVFTFMQMYFIFMNAGLKIHRFKFIARFGLMHVVATNLCVWIKTLVFESLSETARKSVPYFNFSKNIVNTLSTEYNLLDSQKGLLERTTSRSGVRSLSQVVDTASDTSKVFFGQVNTHIRQIPYVLVEATSPNTFSTSTPLRTTTTITPSTSTPIQTPIFTFPTTPSTTPPTNEYITTRTTDAITTIAHTISSHTGTLLRVFHDTFKIGTFTANMSAETENPNVAINFMRSAPNNWSRGTKNFTTNLYNNDSCGRINIMGTTVQNAAPFLYPFVIEYSLIGAAVIFIMWRQIGRAPRYVSEENIEHKLDVILSQKAVAIAHVHNGDGRVDCIGSSKGLFFGLLLLVGSLIAMLLFFVLIHHQQFSWLAVYLADATHSVIMALSILAIIIGFFRVKNLRFYATDTTDLNDILLRVSAFGVFVYASFCIIAGARYALVKERNLLVLITGTITIFQVVLQILFIGDISRRHVYLPEHDRNKPGRQIVTFLLICNITMWILFTFESQKVLANPVQFDFFGKRTWQLVEYLTLPLCIFHRFHSAVALAEIWKNSYKPRLD